MSSLLQDLRYAFRGLAKSPGFSAIAIATLALGIGANTSIFALVDRVLLRTLPVRDPGELVLLRSPGPSQGHTWSDGDDDASFSYPMYRDLRDRASVFAGLVAEYPFAVSIAARGETERAAGEMVSGSYFDVLGVPPELGRVLTPGDDLAPGGHPVAVLSHGYFARRFGGDPSVLNKTIVANGQTLTVVGVARRGFPGIQPGRQADIFVPMMMKAQMTPLWNALDDPKDRWVQIVGRLKPGLSRSAAETALVSVYRSLLQELLPQMKGWDEKVQQRFLERKVLLVEGGHGRAVLRSDVGTPLLSLMGMVVLVLLIACSNLAGLLAARGAARQREYGIRLAIGASRFQLLRQSIVECLVFAFAGGALGLLVAAWTLQTLLSAFPADDGLRQLGVSIDPRVLGFTALASLVAGLLFGLAPSWRAARLDPARTLRGQGRGCASAGREVIRFRQWLVTAQVALTLVLLVCALLFVRSLRNLGAVELGFKPESVIGFSIAPKLNGYPVARTTALARQLSENLAAVPGVRSVSAGKEPLMAGSTESGNITLEGAQGASKEQQNARFNYVGPDYFATLGIPLIAGRELQWTDDAAAPKVAIVNEALVRRYFGDRSPIGSRLAVGGHGEVAPDTEIVGVVRNSKAAQVDEKDEAFVYRPYLQHPTIGELSFSVRAAGEPASLVSAIREQVKRLDAQLPVYDLRPLQTQIRDSLVTQRVIVLLSTAFGMLAAVLAALGIYGVLAFAVAERRQEIGVRMALGADPAAVRGMIFHEVLRFLLIGVAIGLPAAWALGRAVESILFGVHAADPDTFAIGTALMTLVALAAAWPPALRASRTNAIEALRSE